MYATQKVTVREIKVSGRESSLSENGREAQRTIDTYLSTRPEIMDGVDEMRKASNPPPSKQQISIDTFLTKKPSPTKISNEISAYECTSRPPYLQAELRLRAPHDRSSVETPRSNPRPHSSPYVADSDGISSNHEPTIRFESKSSPLPQAHASTYQPGELSPNTKAKIEANRLKALARRNQILTEKMVQVLPTPSLPTVQLINQNPVPQALVLSHAKATPQATSSYFGEKTKSLPPPNDLCHSRPPCDTALSHSSGTGHVFSTGTGNALRVSQDAIDRANHIFLNPTTPTNPAKKVRSID
jgi:hypothetical protein